MKQENAKNMRHLIGSIKMSSPPEILSSYITGDPVIKPFMLKLSSDIQNSGGAFLVHGVQCKIKNEQLIPDVIVHENSKFFYNCNSKQVLPGNIFIWNDERKKWVDVATTSQQVQKLSDNRKKWLKLSKCLEKTYGYTKTESRRFFRNLKLSGVEELIDWLNFLYESNPPKAFVQHVLTSCSSINSIEKKLGFSCNNLTVAQEALRHYIKN